VADKNYNVLFICTRNSARSILAEGLLNELGQGRFRAYSAGSHPRAEVHALALQTLQSLHVPIDGMRSKSWEEFAAAGAPEMNFVFTVCDQAAGELCPVWPGQPMTAHWGMPDPAAVEGPDDVKAKAFRAAAVTLKRRLELMLALPLDRLDAMAIRKEVKDIGTA
jgi:protein-tyrosine-phosphatase